MLVGDQRTLNRNKKWDELKTATHDLPKAIAVVSELLKDADAEERETLLGVKTTLDARRSSQIRGRIFWGVAVAILVGFLIYDSQDKTARRTSSNREWSQPTAQPYPPATLPSAQDLREQKPPIGTDRFFDTPEVRYCVYQAERLSILRSYISNNREISRLNQLIGDFNSRCSSYRYRPSVLDKIKSELPSKRNNLISEARLLLYF